MAGGTGDLNIFFERVNMLMYFKIWPGKYIMGYSDKAKKYKVSEWFDEWMKLYKIGRIKTNTVRGYVDGFERATDFIGSVRLCIGEISALLWSDIDFEKHRIRVCKTLNETTVFYDDSKNRLEETYSKKQITTRIGNHICLVYIHISFGILLSRE